MDLGKGIVGKSLKTDDKGNEERKAAHACNAKETRRRWYELGRQIF